LIGRKTAALPGILRDFLDKMAIFSQVARDFRRADAQDGQPPVPDI
jgi:hypothetical protein